jgi:hypothetical protein
MSGTRPAPAAPRLHGSYFVVHALTLLGSSITGITCFLQVGASFPQLGYVSAALALKTLAMITVGMLAPGVIARWSLRWTLVAAQAAGIAALAVVYAGFRLHSFALAMAGMILAGVPTVLLNIVSTSALKLQSGEPAAFFKLQGRMAAIGGGAFLGAALLAPLALQRLGLGGVLAFDAITYGVAALYLASAAGAWLRGGAAAEAAAGAAPRPGVAPAHDAPALRFALLAVPAFLLVGLLPLVASSGATVWTAALLQAGISPGQVWALEAIAVLGAGMVYARASARAWPRRLLDLPLPPALLLLPLYFIGTHVLVVLPLLLLTGLATQLKFMRVRDQYLLRARSGAETVRASAMASMVGNGLMFLSPIVLAPLVSADADPALSALLLAAGLLLFQFAAHAMVLRRRRAAAA